jgi:Carboxypeptidase regulatory-like domain
MKLAALITVLLLSAGFAPAGVISGRIFDCETQRPVANAYITIATAAGLELGTTGTDHEGRFRRDGVPAGFHRFIAWRGSEGSDPLPEIAVRPGEEVSTVVFVLEPRAQVRVRIETPSGRPARSVRCAMDCPPDVVEAIRRPTGSYELRAARGTWTLHVDVPGFRSHVEELELEDYDRRFLTIELTTGVSVLGRVLDEDGQPIRGAIVDRLRVSEPVNQAASWTTDESGRFDLAGGAPVPTRFRVSALGHVPVVSRLDLSRAGLILRQDFVMKRLPKGGALTGRVIDLRKEGVSGVRVTAGIPRLPLKLETTTAKDGSFRFEDVPAGGVYVTIDDDDEALWPDATAANPGGRVVLFRRKMAEIVVRPRFPDGSAPTLWRLRVAGGDAATTHLRPAARLRIEGERETTLIVDVPGHPSPEPITLKAAWDGVQELNVPLDPHPRTATLAAWVLARDDLPLDVPFSVRVTHPDGAVTEEKADALGGIVLRRLPAGPYRIRVARAGRPKDEDSPVLDLTLEKDGRVGRTLRVDPALLVVEDKGDASEPGPLRTGDGLTWAAGTRLEQRSDLEEILEFFGDRKIGLEFVRDGKVVSVRAPASSLTRYRLAECFR